MRSFLSVLVLFLFSALPSEAQSANVSPKSQRIDSLQQELSHAKEDTDKLLVYRSLLFNLIDKYHLLYTDIELAKTYIDEARTLAYRIESNESKLVIKFYEGILDPDNGEVRFKKFFDLIDESREQKIPAIESNCYIAIGNIWQTKRKYDKALEYFKKAELVYEELGDVTNCFTPYGNIASSLLRKGKLEGVSFNLKKELQIHEELNNLSYVSKLYILEQIYNEQNGKFEEGIASIKKAIQISKDIGDWASYRTGSNNLAALYSFNKDWKKAKQIFLENIKDKEGNKSLLASNYSSLGTVYMNLNQVDSSNYFYDKSINLSKITGDFDQLIYTSLSAAHMNAKVNNLSKTFQLYFRALTISQERKDTFNLGKTYISFSRLHKKLNNWNKAITYANQAKEMYQVIKDTSSLLESYDLLNKLNLRSQKYTPVESDINEAIKLSKIFGDSCSLYSNYILLAHLQSEMNNIDSSDYYLNIATPKVMECNSLSNTASAFIISGNNYLEKGQIDKAKMSLEKSIFYSTKSKNRELIAEAAEILHPLYKKENNFTKAYEVLALFQKNKETNFSGAAAFMEKEASLSFEKEKQAADQVYTEKINRQKWMTRGAILAFLFSLGIVGLLLKNFRDKKKSNVILSKKNEEITKQKVELEKMDDMKSQFFANISHELRTPLTLISSPVDQLLENKQSSLNPSEVQELELVQRNTNRLKGLVNDIMDLSKLESSELEIDAREVDVSAYLRRIINNYDSLAVHLGLSLQLKNDIPERSYFKMDADKIEKVINNLLSNAIKHTPSGGTITLQSDIHNNGLQIVVNDTGKGIPKEDIQSIFDRYFQSNNAQSTVQGGTGLGLALAKELTNLMNGTIAAESTLGEGSTFSFWFPSVQVDDIKYIPIPVTNPAQPQQASTKSKKIFASDNDEKHSVLIVEDNKDMQDFIRRLLDEQYHTHVANHGKQAIEMLDTLQVDLILSDVMMPEMDGYSLLKYLKEHKTLKQIPVIMLTALDSQDKKLEALTLGVDDYMNKPFSPNELLARTFNLIERYDVRKSVQLAIANEKEEIALIEPTKVKTEASITQTTPKIVKEVILEDVISEKGVGEENSWLKNVEKIMREELENSEFKLSDLASRLLLSERQFQRRMNQLTGLTPKKYQREVALQYARELLEKRAYGTVKAIAYTVGINNVWRFSQQYEERFGKKPSTYFKS